VASLSPIPIIVYNIPAFTGIDMSEQTILKIAEHENIIGIKENSGILFQSLFLSLSLFECLYLSGKTTKKKKKTKT
jgi:dihydrodipicolinate synthase/N-acetylneuraminate lyase